MVHRDESSQPDSFSQKFKPENLGILNQLTVGAETEKLSYSTGSQTLVCLRISEKLVKTADSWVPRPEILISSLGGRLRTLRS